MSLDAFRERPHSEEWRCIHRKHGYSVHHIDTRLNVVQRVQVRNEVNRCHRVAQCIEQFRKTGSRRNPQSDVDHVHAVLAHECGGIAYPSQQARRSLWKAARAAIFEEAEQFDAQQGLLLEHPAQQESLFIDSDDDGGPRLPAPAADMEQETSHADRTAPQHGRGEQEPCDQDAVGQFDPQAGKVEHQGDARADGNPPHSDIQQAADFPRCRRIAIHPSVAQEFRRSSKRQHCNQEVSSTEWALSDPQARREQRNGGHRVEQSLDQKHGAGIKRRHIVRRVVHRPPARDPRAW